MEGLAPREVMKRIIAVAVDLGFDWNRNVAGDIGFTTAYTGSTYAELVYQNGSKWMAVNVRVSDHSCAPSRVSDNYHVITDSPNVASQVARVMRALGDAKVAVDSAGTPSTGG